MRVSAWMKLVVVVAATLVLAACGNSAQSSRGSSGSSGSSSSSGSSTPTPTPASGPVKTATATVQGKSETIFVNTQGMALYYYTPDKDASVTCTGGCAAAWPPVAAGSATPESLSGVSGTFASDPNPAGGSVVTYNGWPLYTYVKDTAPGQVNGQGVGNVWFVATPSLAATPTGS